MDIKNEYEKLYQHWLKEFRQLELTLLPMESFNNYKNAINYVNEFRPNQNEKISNEILKSYQENFNFLFNDLLKIREIKIINFALALQEINLNNLVEAEKLLYQNLISILKGFKKVRDFSVYEEVQDDKIKNILENAIIENSNDYESEKIELKREFARPKVGFKLNKEDVNYTLVRFLTKTPPLVGVDLINYGPFEKEDIANIPYKNAKILIGEKFAEKIDLD